MREVKKILQYSLIAFAVQTGLLFNSAHGMNVKETKECSICFEQISDKDAKKTSCEHIFHRNCLDQWYVTSKHKNCPICRKKLASAPSKLEQKRAQEQLKNKRARELEQANYARRLQEQEYQRTINTRQRARNRLVVVSHTPLQTRRPQQSHVRTKNKSTNIQRRKKRPQPKRQTKRSSSRRKQVRSPQVKEKQPSKVAQNRTIRAALTPCCHFQESGHDTVLAKCLVFAITIGMVSHIVQRTMPRWLAKQTNTFATSLCCLMVAPVAYGATQSDRLVEKSKACVAWLKNKLRMR